MGNRQLPVGLVLRLSSTLPMKPGRTSHVYQAYYIAGLRMLLNVDVQAGNQTAAEYAQARLCGELDARPEEQWPAMLRGDIAWGTEKTMRECEARQLPYLFKLWQTEGVVKHLVEIARRREWKYAGGEWRAETSSLQLQGWTKKRRVAVMRRVAAANNVGDETETSTGHKISAGMVVLPKNQRLLAYAVLVTSLPEEDLLTVAQQYRDRGDAEKIFDELKNQWA